MNFTSEFLAVVNISHFIYIHQNVIEVASNRLFSLYMVMVQLQFVLGHSKQRRLPFGPL